MTWSFRPMHAVEQPRPDEKRRIRQTGLVLLSLALSAGLLAVLVVFSGLTAEGLWNAIRAVPAWFYLPIAAAQAAIIVLAAWKWCLVLRGTAGARVTLRDATAATTFATLAGQVLPIQFVTPVARAWVGRLRGVSPGRAIGTSLLEQSFELLVLGAMAVAAGVTLFLGMTLQLGLGVSLMAAAIMTLLVRPGLLLGARLAAVASDAVRGRAGEQFGKLAEGFAASARLPYSALFQITGLGFVRYALLAGLNVLILGTLAPGAGLLVLLTAFPLVLLLMSLPFFPGGLGVVELTWVGVLVAQGESAAAAAEAALALRIVSTFGFFLVAPALLFLRPSAKGTPA